MSLNATALDYLDKFDISTEQMRDVLVEVRNFMQCQHSLLLQKGDLMASGLEWDQVLNVSIISLARLVRYGPKSPREA